MDAYFDLIARHKAHSHRFGSYTYNRILAQLERADKRITIRLQEQMEGLTQREINELVAGNFTTKRLIALRESVREMASQARRLTNGELKPRAQELIEYEQGFSVDALNVVAVVPEFTQVSVAQVYSAANARPMIGRHVRDWVKDLDTDTRNLVFGEIRDGLVIGDSIPTIVRRIRGTVADGGGILSTRNNRLEGIVRTSLNHYTTAANRMTYEAMGVKKYRWLSVLDPRTSPICGPRDGNVYEWDKGPLPPAHPNCRSEIIPEIGAEPSGSLPFVRSTTDKPLGKMTKKERAETVIGSVSANTTFSTWFRRQDAEFQRHWLGKTRYDLYKKGGIKLDRFSDPRKDKVYTIAELRRRDSEAFTKAGL